MRCLIRHWPPSSDRDCADADVVALQAADIAIAATPNLIIDYLSVCALHHFPLYASHRPARASERAPKARKIRSRNPAGPGAGVIVAVNFALTGAAACLHRMRAHGLG